MSSIKLPRISVPPPPLKYDDKELEDISPVDNISLEEALGRGLATNKIQISNSVAKTVLLDKFVRDQKNSGVFKPIDFEDNITPQMAAKEGIDIEENTSRVKLEFMKTYKAQDEKVINEFGEVALQLDNIPAAIVTWFGAFAGGYLEPLTLMAEWGLAKWTGGGSVILGAGKRMNKLYDIVQASRAAQMARKLAPAVISNKTAQLAKIGDTLGRLGARMATPVVKGLKTKSGAGFERVILVNSIEEGIIHQLSQDRGFNYSLPQALGFGVFTAAAFKALGYGLGKAGSAARSRMLDLDSFTGGKGGSIAQRILRIQELEGQYTGIDLKKAVKETDMAPEVKLIVTRSLETIAEQEAIIAKIGRRDKGLARKLELLNAKLKRARSPKSKAKIKKEIEAVKNTSRHSASELQGAVAAREKAQKAVVNAPGEVLKARVKKVRAEREALRNRIHAERIDLIKRLTNPADVLKVAKYMAIPEFELNHFRAMKAVQDKFGASYVQKLKTYAAGIAGQGYRINPNKLFPALENLKVFKKTYKDHMMKKYGKTWNKTQPDESDFDAIFSLKKDDMNAYHDKNYNKKLDEPKPHKPPTPTTPTKQLDEALDAASGTTAGDFFGGLNVEMKKFFKCLATPPKGSLDE